MISVVADESLHYSANEVDDDDTTTTKLIEKETFYLTYFMIATSKEGKKGGNLKSE